jgi:hypothetical protein
MSTEPKKEIELVPDAWERFERAVDVVAKSPPQPRTSTAKQESHSSKPKERPNKRK